MEKAKKYNPLPRYYLPFVSYCYLMRFACTEESQSMVEAHAGENHQRGNECVRVYVYAWKPQSHTRAVSVCFTVSVFSLEGSFLQ